VSDVINPPRILRVPRGTPGKAPLELDMTVLDEAERRLHEVRMVSHATSRELGGLFNQAANEAGKYVAWVEYEILKATKQYELDKATVILDKAPEKAAEMKEAGMKMNEAIRDAMIARDEDCMRSLDILNALQAAKKLLETSFWSFLRSYQSADAVSNAKGQAPTPNFSSGHVGQTYDIPQMNIMGRDERKNNG
jgi:hypothetical protein